MAHFSKDIYDKKKQYADKKAIDNEAVLISHGISEADAELLSELSGIRHAIHTNTHKERVESKDYTLTAPDGKGYLVIPDIDVDQPHINNYLKSINLPPIDIKGVGRILNYDVESHVNSYHDYDMVDEAIYEDLEDQLSELSDEEKEDKFSEILSSLVYENNNRKLELLNDRIREYFGKINDLYGTKYPAKMEYERGGTVDYNRVVSASSRFRPKETVFFEPPLVGLNGAKLVSYTWSYEWVEDWNAHIGETVNKRISDWTQAELSADTGRNIVHKYDIELPEGTVKTVSSESVHILLGYVDRKDMKSFPNLVTASKTLAKQQMKLAILEAQLKEYEELRAKYENEIKPKVVEIEEPIDFLRSHIDEGRGATHTVYQMGDVWERQDNPFRYGSTSEQSKHVPLGYANKETIEQLTYNWVAKRIEESGGKYPNGIHDLRNRVERQKRKVSEILKATDNKETFEEGGVVTDENRQELIEGIKSILENAGYYVGYSAHSETDYGTSDYLHASVGVAGNDDYKSVKIRVSDHDISNVVRVSKEIDCRVGRTKPKDVLDAVNFDLRRDDFFYEDVVFKKSEKEIEVPEHDLNPTDTIVSFRESKSNKKIYKVIRVYNNRYRVWRRKSNDDIFWWIDNMNNYADGGEVKHDEHSHIYQEWKRLVNMNKSELQEFYDSEEGKEAGLSAHEAQEQEIHSGRESARWILKMKDMPVDDWTDTMWDWAKRQISFIKRMSGNSGALYDEKGNKTRKYTSLLIWGHNPKKHADGGETDSTQQSIAPYLMSLPEYIEYQRAHDSYPIKDKSWERNEQAYYTKLTRESLQRERVKEGYAWVEAPSKMQVAINEGKISIEKAVENIISAGLIVPDEILRNKSNDMSMTNNEVEVLESEPIVAEKNSKTLFWGGNWFAQHPEKVLGIAYETSGRYGNVTKYRGDIKAVELIDVPLDFIGNLHESNPLDSETGDENLSAKETLPSVVEMVKDAISECNFDIQEAKRTRKIKAAKQKKIFLSSEPDAEAELQTFEEVWERYNSTETKENTEVFVWYKSHIGKPLSKRWINLIHPNKYSESEYRDTLAYEVSEEKITEWVKEGKLYYTDGSLEPSFIYLSGNIYDKKASLRRDRKHIISKYGEDVFNKQETKLEQVFRVKYDERLTLTGSNKDGLAILAISKLAETFKIERIEDLPEDSNFRIKAVSAKSKTNYGEPDFEAEVNGYTRGYQETFEQLSLKYAFCWWLIKSKPELKASVTYLLIIKHYVLQKPVIVNTKGIKEVSEKKVRAAAEMKKASCQKEGERLFAYFLANQLLPNDKVRLETQWNAQYNNYVPVDTNQVPVAFTMCKNYKGTFEELRSEKREAVAFLLSNGSGCLAYDVGVGKTNSFIFTMSAFLDAGYCTRPMLCVPNQVYKQFVSEIRNFAPHIKVNEAYNLSPEFAEQFKGEDGQIHLVDNGSITVMTYEGLETIGFNESTKETIMESLYEILNQGGESERQKSGFKTKLEELVGKGVRGTAYAIEDFGFDFAGYDEAHKMKKLFCSVKGDVSEDENSGKQKRGKSPYAINSGTPSSIALKGFMLNQYILRNNNYQNIILMTATPFTNSPLEIFSMLTMIAYEQLKKTDLNNIKSFFDNYIATSTELVIDAKLKPLLKQVILGFNNLISLQSLIRKYISYKTGDEIESIRKKRPKKYVLPMKNKVVEDTYITLDESERIDTTITMKDEQARMMLDIFAYVGGDLSLSDLIQYNQQPEDEELNGQEIEDDSSDDTPLGKLESLAKRSKGIKVFRRELELLAHEDKTFLENVYADLSINPKDKKDINEKIKEFYDTQKNGGEVVEVDEEDLDEKQKLGVRTLKGLSWSRNLALSPYLYEHSGMRNPTYLEYIEESPKLSYVMECVRYARQHHIDKGTPISGQVIYMDRGIQYFGLIKQYLVNVIGFKSHEVGIIVSGLPKEGKRSKEYIKNLFNGEVYNEETREMQTVLDDERIKVIIGSSTIKEGMNLQKYGTVLYNCFLDWNPTDVQQLIGRIYRQGNSFKAVRIVNPLVVDSADIFIFQKLEEKTARLNSIWALDNKTASLNTQEFEPSELKYQLIRDPNIIAELKIIDKKNEFAGEKIALEGLKEKIEKLIEDTDTVNQWFEKVVDLIKPYRNFTHTDNKLNDAIKLVELVVDAEKKRTDIEGRPIIDSYEYQINWNDTEQIREKKRKLRESASPVSRLNKSYWFSYFSTAVRDIKRAMKDFITQRDIEYRLDDLTGLKEYQAGIDQKIADIKEIEERYESKEMRDIIVQEVIEERLANKIEYKSIGRLVGEFARLNYLLDETIVPTKVFEQIQMEATPPMPLPLDEKYAGILDEVNAQIYTQSGMAESIEESETDTASIIEKIETLKAGIEYFEGEELTELLEAIELLEMALEFQD